MARKAQTPIMKGGPKKKPDLQELACLVQCVSDQLVHIEKQVLHLTHEGDKILKLLQHGHKELSPSQQAVVDKIFTQATASTKKLDDAMATPTKEP